MNVFNRVTFQSLKKNKTRTVVTVIGIMLSAAMICAVTTFAGSIFHYGYENAVYMNGDWHGVVEGVDFNTYSTISDNEKVADAVYARQLGYAKVDGCQNENKPYLFVLGVSDGFEETMPIHITGGRFPASADEILIPDHLYENGGVRYCLGDKLELGLGKRMLDGFSLGQHTPFYVYDENHEEIPSGESLSVEMTRTYTVVGFYERPTFEEYTAPGYTAITAGSNADFDLAQYNVWFSMDKMKEVYSFMEDNELNGNTNQSVLRYAGISRYDGINTMILSLAAIVICLIMVGSVSLIYNAFSISVAERTRQFGLLSSVGATKKQLRRMVVTEAMMVSIIGIPLGIMAGVCGIGVTLYFVGDKFNTLIGYPIPLRLNVSVPALVMATVIALMTVLLSAYIPSKRATKVSAIEAIRQSKDIHTKRKEVRTSKITYMLFGLPGVLANKYYKRNRKKYRATVISLFMSVVLFISAFTFTSALTESADDSFGNVNYDILIHGVEKEFEHVSVEEVLASLKNDKGVDKAAYAQGASFFASVDPDEMTNDYLTYYAASEKEDLKDLENVGVYTTYKFVDNETFGELLKKYNLRETDYFNCNAPLGIAVDGRSVFDGTMGKFVTHKVFAEKEAELRLFVEKEIEGYWLESVSEHEHGKSQYVYRSLEEPEATLTLSEEEALREITTKIGTVIYEDPYFLDTDAQLAVVYPIGMRDAVVPDVNLNAYDFYILSETHAQTMSAIEETLDSLGLSALRTRNLAMDEEENRNIVTIIRVFAYGFIVLISLIAAANVFNTISTNVALRRREFAMLKSVGMTASGFNRMMCFECVLYGCHALLLGIPVSIGISYLIHLAVSEGFQKQFVMPWLAFIIAVCSVFAVVFVTMMYSMRKIKRDDPIEALKNENL